MSEPVKIIPPFFRPQNLVIGCCNSLVCILILNYNDLYSPFDDFEIVIWNPSIKKYKSLPFEPIEGNLLEQSLAFRDDPVNNDYKVLVIVFVTIDYRMKPLEILVYSLKAHSLGKSRRSIALQGFKYLVNYGHMHHTNFNENTPN
jgi:hypothetical protein